MNDIRKILTFVLLFAGLSAGAQNQQSTGIRVTGTVLNASTNLPVELAAVHCSNFSSTFTEKDGRFSIEVRSKNDVLTIRASGFQSKDVFLSGRETVSVYLNQEGAFSFQEFGYSAFSSRKQLYETQASSVTHPERESISRLSPGSAEASFDGPIAGLEARARNGIKGAGSDLFIRGYSSIYANNQPLVLVDGMIYDTRIYGSSMIKGFRPNPLSGIDVGDIEHVSVVKDALPIYGAQASNGVIFIRTSHADEQATSIDFSMNGTLEMAPDEIPLLGAEDYRLFLNELFLTKGLTADSIASMPFQNLDPSLMNYPAYRNNTDWQKKVFADNYSTQFRLKIKGGDDIALYALSIGYLGQKGTVTGSDHSRFNFRFNSDIRFSQKVTLNANISFHYTTKNITATGMESPYDPVHQARIKAPFLQEYIQNEQGIASPDLSDYDFLEVSNPMALLRYMTQKDINYRLFGSFNFNWKISKNFTISDMVGLSFDKTRQSVFIPDQGVAPDSSAIEPITNQMKANILRHFTINNDLRALYQKDLGFDHNLSLMGGARFSINTLEEDWAADYNSANDQIRTLGNGNYLLRQKGGTLGDWSNLTLYLNADYRFKNRYLLTLSASLDGSSRYGSEADGVKILGSCFGVYPGAALAWIVSSEPFLANTRAIDLLKIRFSYGLTGNDDIGNYTAQRYYVEKNFLSYQGLVAGNLWNPSLGAEKNAKMNIGLDFSAFKERISLTFDLFQNQTTHLFDYITAPSLSGYYGYFGNMGGFTTRGMDLSINARVVRTPSIQWDLGAVVSKYTTRVDALFDQSRTASILGAEILTRVGEPIGLFYGYETNGVYASDQVARESGLLNRMNNEQTVPFAGGDVIFIDHHEDGIIDEEDKTIIGDPTPDFTGEIFTRLKFAGFTLDASLGFSYGGEVYNYLRYSLENMSTTGNQTLATRNRWKYEGQETRMPRAVYGDPAGNSRFSDRWIEDGSYARLKNVTLSYRLPIGTKLVRYAEIYASGINLVTLTRYLGPDPEFSLNGFALAQGIDAGMIPQNKMVLLGIRIGL
ncbi:MAG TPA: SusC/RagA family TonB-linked outer membrane protein [Prolixibacteraceae bacterium]|nr:SusC/RagA family TonB-linked outer membrane protein [Prolixibacteraceae bacterium]